MHGAAPLTTAPPAQNPPCQYSQPPALKCSAGPAQKAASRTHQWAREACGSMLHIPAARCAAEEPQLPPPIWAGPQAHTCSSSWCIATLVKSLVLEATGMRSFDDMGTPSSWLAVPNAACGGVGGSRERRWAAWQPAWLPVRLRCAPAAAVHYIARPGLPCRVCQLPCRCTPPRPTTGLRARACRRQCLWAPLAMLACGWIKQAASLPYLGTPAHPGR